MKKRFFAFLHNAIAHPLLCTGTRWADQFHDYTSLIAFGPATPTTEELMDRLKPYLLSDNGRFLNFGLYVKRSGANPDKITDREFVAGYYPIAEQSSTHSRRTGYGASPANALLQLWEKYPEYRKRDNK